MPKKEMISRRFQFTSKNIKGLPIHDRNSPSTDQEYSDTEVIGLKVFVSKTGRKSFHLRYWLNNRKRVIKIADADCLLLPEIRAIARNYRGMIAKGLDPLEERLKRKSTPTFRNFIEEQYLKWAKVNNSAQCPVIHGFFYFYRRTDMDKTESVSTRNLCSRRIDDEKSERKLVSQIATFVIEFSLFLNFFPYIVVFLALFGAVLLARKG